MEIEIDTSDKKLCADLFGNPTTITEGMKAQLPMGGDIQLKEWRFYKAEGISDTVALLLSFPMGVVSGLVANWLWSKIDGRVTGLRINEVDVQINEMEIQRIVTEQLEYARTEMKGKSRTTNLFQRTALKDYAIACGTWLQNRVEDAEARDPKLRPMKDAINRIAEQIRSAKEDEWPSLFAEQDAAIKKLLRHIQDKDYNLPF